MWKVNWSAWQAVWDNESFRQESNPVGQESNRSPDVREVMGSIPVRDGFFFFAPRSCHVGQLTFQNLICSVTRGK